jgi:ABC-2 type transport system permease protein
MKLHRIKAMLLNYYYFSINSWDRLFDVFYWPVLDIFIWGFMTHFIAGISDFNILNTILGGIILWVFVWRASQDLVVYLLESYWSRGIYYLFASPLKSSEYVISLGILGVLRSIVAFLLLALLSMVLYGFNFFSFNLVHISMFIALLLLFGWGLGIIVSSLVFRFGTRVQVLAWSTIWIIQPFSCVFYPLSALPAWAAKIAVVLPTTHIFEQLRASMSGMPLSYGSLAYAACFIVVFIVVSSLVLVQSIKAARVRGSFAKPE